MIQYKTDNARNETVSLLTVKTMIKPYELQAIQLSESCREILKSEPSHTHTHVTNNSSQLYTDAIVRGTDHDNGC